MDRLPPLNAVRAFEAVGRHLSMTQAAEELHVTPGAISRQIQLLEEHLGTALLTRGHRQITLTRQGKDFHRVASQAVDLLRAASARMKKKAKRRQLKIRAYTTFAMRWLIPRLSSFHAAHPDVEVLLTASLDPVDFKREDLDGAIRLGDGKWPGAVAHRLVSNILVPVASPKLLKEGPPLRKPADLAQPHAAAFDRAARRLGLLARSRRRGRPGGRAFGHDLRELRFRVHRGHGRPRRGHRPTFPGGG